MHESTYVHGFMHMYVGLILHTHNDFQKSYTRQVFCIYVEV